MGQHDQRIDAYIARAQPFARPILTQLRALVHRVCPEAEETVKWRMPFFTYRGTLCMMAAFKSHCVFGFWKAKILFGEASVGERQAMSHFGRIASLADLPPRAELKRLIRAAMALNEQGAPSPRAKPAAKKAPRVPPELTKALAGNTAARKAFAAFPPGKRREYAEWIAEAKRPETRDKRLADAVAWIAQGKSRNWKYER